METRYNEQKQMKNNLDITKPRYCEQILPVSCPFVTSGFHCTKGWIEHTRWNASQRLSTALAGIGIWWGCFGLNRPFPSSPEPLFQNEGRCSAFDMEIIFHSHANKTHFHKKGCAPSLLLKVRVFGTRKWPIGLKWLQERLIQSLACRDVLLTHKKMFQP